MFKCRDLLSLPTMSRAKLISGKSGLDNGIRWSYKAEGMNFANWIHGQELLIVSTPVINSIDFDLHKLIEEAISLKLSGVLLLVGEDYISSIAKKTLNLADKCALPIISLPGEVPLVDIFEELGHAIVFQDQRQSDNDDLLSSIIFGNKIDARQISTRAGLLGYDINKTQRIFMVRVLMGDDSDFDQMNLLLEQLVNLFHGHGSNAVISRFHCNLIGLTGETDEEKINNIFAEFLNIEMECKPIYQIGIGSGYDDLEMLGQSFSEASAVIKFANPVQWYEKLGFLKFFINSENKNGLLEYMDQILGNVIKHDRDNKSDLLNTLIAYFECNENMKEVGNKIFIHPNTVKYRLQQIQDLSGLDLSVSSDKMELYNALLIWRIR